MKGTGTLLASIVAAGVAIPAFAALGGDSTSVQADVARMKGTLRITSASGVRVHEITTSSGTVVREYITPGDKVFAISWRGPVMPDLSQILGSYYGQFAQSAAAPRPHDHHHLMVEHPGLVVQSSGHMRAFFGRAWAPDLLPQNFPASEIN